MVELSDGKKSLRIFNRLDTIPACDRRTVRHLATPRYAYASRDKN